MVATELPGSSFCRKQLQGCNKSTEQRKLLLVSKRSCSDTCLGLQLLLPAGRKLSAHTQRECVQAAGQTQCVQAPGQTGCCHTHFLREPPQVLILSALLLWGPVCSRRSSRVEFTADMRAPRRKQGMPSSGEMVPSCYRNREGFLEEAVLHLGVRGWAEFKRMK